MFDDEIKARLISKDYFAAAGNDCLGLETGALVTEQPQPQLELGYGLGPERLVSVLPFGRIRRIRLPRKSKLVVGPRFPHSVVRGVWPCRELQVRWCLLRDGHEQGPIELIGIGKRQSGINLEVAVINILSRGALE